MDPKETLKLLGWILLFVLPYLTFLARPWLEVVYPLGRLFIPVWFWFYFIIGIAMFAIGFIFIEKRASDYLLAAGGLVTSGIVSAFFLYALWSLAIRPFFYF